jgi:hypothetical protein
MRPSGSTFPPPVNVLPRVSEAVAEASGCSLSASRTRGVASAARACKAARSTTNFTSTSLFGSSTVPRRPSL